MIEVCPNLFVGTQDDEAIVRGDPNWYVISAAKEKYHRQALGYTTRAAPKDHPEYLIADRPGTLILNLVDAEHPEYVSETIVNACLGAIDKNINDRKVLLHCNQGFSRAPTLALLYLHHRTDRFPQKDFDEAVSAFREIYPNYAPAKGMELFARAHWNDLNPLAQIPENP